MALRIPKRTNHLESLKNLSKRFLTSRYDGQSNDKNKGEINENVDVNYKDYKDFCGSYRYRVCNERSTPIERPQTIIENQYNKNQINLQHLQPSTLPTFQKRDISDAVGLNVKININQGRKTKPTEVLSGLQASKTYSNVQLPLKVIRLASPFPEPVKIMDSCKVSDEEKAEMMLKEAKSAKLLQQQQQQQRRNYSSFATQKVCKEIKSEPALKRTFTQNKGPSGNNIQQLLTKTATRLIKEKQFSSLNNKKLTEALMKPPEFGGFNGGGNLFFSQQSVNNPKILNLPPDSSGNTISAITMKNVKMPPIKMDVFLKSLPPKNFTLKATTTPTQTTKILPKTTITPYKPIGFKIKKLETHRTYASNRGGKKRKVDDCGKQTCEKLPKGKQDCPKMCLPGCPPPNKNTACHPIPSKITCTKQEAPYPSYSELCHEDPFEWETECNQCPYSQDNHPHFKPQKKSYHSSTTRHVVPTGPTAGYMYNLYNKTTTTTTTINDTMDCSMKKKPCEPPCGNTCEEKMQREREREKKKKRDECGNEIKPKKKDCKSLKQIMNNFISKRTESLIFASRRNSGCEEEMPLCGVTSEEPKCKKFPFPPSPPIKEEDPCPPKRKRRPIKDCPKTCEKECFPVILIPGTSIIEPPVHINVGGGSGIQTFSKKRGNDDRPSRKSTRPTGPPDDPCRLKRKGRSDNCPKNLVRKPRASRDDDDFKKLEPGFSF